MVMVCLLLLVESEHEDGCGGLTDQARTAAGPAEDRPALEHCEGPLDQGADGVDCVVMEGFLLGQVPALERGHYSLSCAGVGLVGIECQVGGFDRPGEAVGAGGGEVVGRTGPGGAAPQQVSVVVGRAGALDRVVAVLVAPVPVDVCALLRSASIVDAVDFAAGGVEQESSQSP